MSNFLFLTFPHVLCCDTVRWQMAVVWQKRSVAHRTGWCLPPAVTTFLHRGGAGTTAGGTACSTPLTWSLSTAHRSRSFSWGTAFEDAVSSPEVVLISALCSLFWAEISFRLHNGSVGWYDWQRGRRKVDLGRWNASKHWAVRCLGREGRICLCLMCLCDRGLLVPDGKVIWSGRTANISLLVPRSAAGASGPGGSLMELLQGKTAVNSV